MKTPSNRIQQHLDGKTAPPQGPTAAAAAAVYRASRPKYASIVQSVLFEVLQSNGTGFALSEGSIVALAADLYKWCHDVITPKRAHDSLVRLSRQTPRLVFQVDGGWKATTHVARPEMESELPNQKPQRPARMPHRNGRSLQDPYGTYHSITLRLTRAQHRALCCLKRGRFKKSANIADVAYFILMLAMQHPELVRSWLFQLIRYTKAEGVPQGKFLSDALARHHAYARTK